MWDAENDERAGCLCSKFPANRYVDIMLTASKEAMNVDTVVFQERRHRLTFTEGSQNVADIHCDRSVDMLHMRFRTKTLKIRNANRGRDSIVKCICRPCLSFLWSLQVWTTRRALIKARAIPTLNDSPSLMPLPASDSICSTNKPFVSSSNAVSSLHSMRA